MADERSSPPARPVQSPGSNSATVHSIEAILGFKEDTIFHKSSYNLTGKDAERSGAVTQMKKAHYADSCDGESGKHSLHSLLKDAKLAQQTTQQQV